MSSRAFITMGIRGQSIGAFAAVALLGNPAEAATTYQATWASVNKHIVAPEWFMDAKFGIYYHWGAFCTPQYGMEWYPRNMYNKAGNSNEYKHHLATYGDPFGDWQYHNFILGKNNKAGVFTQFAPKLKSAGGKFDPDEWARLFDSAGAKFAGPVAEHHDGFSMWDSKANEWNSVAKGPKLDLAKLHATAIRARGLKFMMSMHHAWNFTGYWNFPPVTQTDASLKKLYGQMTTAEEEKLWIDKLKEVIDGYQPDLIWQDLYLGRISEAKRLEFLSYYYNKSVDWNKDVVVTSKDGFQKGEMRDYERGGPADITTPYWLTDDAINSNSWSYVSGMSYYSKTQMLHSLIDRVSKNGNLLLNISPMADGSIPQAQRDLLLAMGDWLRRFGSSIYATRVWSIYGEGPTKMGGGSFTAPVAGTANDIRYTRAKDTSAVYAIFLGWPGNGVKKALTGLNSSRLKLTSGVKVQLMGATPGTDVDLVYSQDANGLNVTFPSSAPYSALAYPVRVQLKALSGLESAEARPATGLGRAFSINGLSKLAVPDGARWVTVMDVRGHVLDRRNLSVADKEFAPIGHGASLVRFDP
ncbi:MAG: alpha-L-fucosidase [Fibrobacterota bacterium]|nr:MAG: alpha-L-fucosidase [Fibrobacterota bacterium]